MLLRTVASPMTAESVEIAGISTVFEGFIVTTEVIVEHHGRTPLDIVTRGVARNATRGTQRMGLRSGAQVLVATRRVPVQRSRTVERATATQTLESGSPHT